MANACPTIGFFLSIFATFGIIFVLASKYWKINSAQSSQASLQGVYSYEGLWVRCTSPMQGQFKCDNYDESYLALPAELQAQRAMMVVAAIVAVAGLIAGAMGLDCITVMAGSRAKVHTGRGGGAGMILAGVLTLSAVSWYAANVVRDFQIQLATNGANSGFVYEFGSALYIGWITSGVALLAGALLACCTCGNNDEDDDNYRYNYKPPTSNKPAGHSTEYV